MADKKVSDLPSLNGADVDPADLLYIVDSSAGAAGSKKITVGQYQLAPVSGGTANTVVYLNGSKVESSSSALTFDGTNLGVGTSSPGTKLDVVGIVQSNNGFQVTGGSTTINTGIWGTAGVLAFNTGSTERMRLDSSGNLGIGTSSPTTKLDISSNSTTTLRVNRLGVADVYLTAGANGIYGLDTASTNLHFGVSNSLKMTLDSSGNLGLGVTPSAWLSGGYIDFPGNGSIGNGSTYSSNTNTVGLNTYYGSGQWRYKTSGLAAQRFGLENGAFTWYIAPSGTAGNAISFTQAMTLTSGGELLVGTTTTPTSSNAGFILAKDASGTYLRNACTITTSRTHFEFVNGNGTVGSISTNGSATAFNTSSDRRLKENIQPAANAAPVIDAIEIVQHDWKAGGHTRFGVIAQDLHAVAPEAVTPGDDGDEIERTWGVDYSKLVPMLIKEIQSLRARVAALEAK